MFKGIALKIWLSFIFIIFVVFSAILIYFPNKQKEIILDQKSNELKEISKNIALSVEYSIKDENFSSLSRSMDYFRNASEISYIAVYNTTDSIRPLLFEVFPNTAKPLLEKKDLFILSKSYFNTDVLSGFVEVAQPKTMVDDLVNNVVRPIYWVLLVAFVFSILFSIYIARRVSLPLIQLAKFTGKIEEGLLEEKVSVPTQNDEVGFLARGLESLRLSLLDSNNKNRILTLGLENQVRLKTNELQILLEQLQEAQKIANFGSYVFDIQSNHWDSSHEFDVIFGIDANYNRDLEGFTQLISEKYKKKVIDAFQKTLSTGENMFLEYEIIRQSDGEKKFVTGYGKVEKDSLNKPAKIFGVIQDISERKTNEEELRRLSLVAKNTSNGVVITDENYRIVWVNESLSKISGYSLEELRDKTPAIFQFEGTCQETKKIIKENLIQRKSVQAEIQNKGKFGQLYWLDIYIEPLFDEENNLTGFIAIEIDITERKKNLELKENYIKKIEESERQIRTINESLEKQVEEKTKSVRNLATFPEQNPSPVFEFISDEKKLNYSNPAGKLLIQNLNWSEDLLWDRFDLSEFDENNPHEFKFLDRIYEVKLFKSIVNNTSRLYLYDVTERKRSEEKLKEYVNKLLQTEEDLREKTSELENAIDRIKLSQAELINKEKLASLGILVAGIAHEVNTPLGAIQASSGNLYKLFNEELMNIIKEVSHEDFIAAIDIFKTVDLKFEIGFAEERNRVKLLLEWIRLNFPGLESPHRLIRNLVTLNLDKSLDRLKSILSLPNFDAQIDLALVFLRTFKSIRIIEDASIKGSTLIKALNAFAHGSGNDNKENVLLKENIDNCILILWNKIKKGASVENKIPEDLQIFASGSELSQIWTNLINNALQASDNKCKIEIDCIVSNDFYSVTFTNDGPKIPEEIKSRIFDPFFTTKLRGEGTGLGLNIVKNILEKMGGTISCESNEERTVFYVNLPKQLKADDQS